MSVKVIQLRPRRKRSTARADSRQALQFLVVLLDTGPVVWRRILVPDSYSFWDLHVAIQDAMGWKDCHLHEFRIAHRQRGSAVRLGIPDRDFPEERPCVADWEAPLAEYFNWETAADRFADPQRRLNRMLRG